MIKAKFDAFGNNPTARDQLSFHVSELSAELLKESACALSDADAIMNATPAIGAVHAFADLMQNLFQCAGSEGQEPMFADYFSDAQLSALQLCVNKAFDTLYKHCSKRLDAIKSNALPNLKFSVAKAVMDAVQEVKPLIVMHSGHSGSEIRKALCSAEEALVTTLNHLVDPSGYYKSPLSLQQLNESPPKMVVESFPDGPQFKKARGLLNERLANEIIDRLNEIKGFLATNLVTAKTTSSQSGTGTNTIKPMGHSYLAATASSLAKAVPQVSSASSTSIKQTRSSEPPTDIGAYMSTAACEKILADIETLGSYFPVAAVKAYETLLGEVTRELKSIKKKEDHKENELLAKRLEDQLSERLEAFNNLKYGCQYAVS